jgi:uncharacterized membrane protein (DUF373 family)
MEKPDPDNFIHNNPDPLIRYLNQLVVICVKCLAILMVLVIWIAFVDVVMNLYEQIVTPPLFSIENLINTLGNFLAVLIAIEIFVNIIFYLSEDSVNVPLVLATALTAAARKVILIDSKILSPLHVFGLAAVILATGITYWLITAKSNHKPNNP